MNRSESQGVQGPGRMKERSDRQKRGKNAIKDELGGGVQTNDPACSHCCGFLSMRGVLQKGGSGGVVSADKEEEFQGGSLPRIVKNSASSPEAPTIRCNAAKHGGVRNSFQQSGVVCLNLLIISSA